jgi:NTE family protein
VRLRDGERVVFGRDPAPGAPGCPPLARAVEASSAIPGYFEPVEIDNELYLDGAAHSSTNADVLAGLGLDGVVVISPMSAVGEALQWHPRWVSRAGYHKVLGLEVDEVEAGGTPVLVFEPTGADLELMQGGAMDDSGEAELVELAYETATDRLHRLGITDLARSWGR